MIPDWLRDKLATPPQAGAGIHAWLFSVARQLHAHMPAEAIGAVLAAATAGAARRVTNREIRDAVNNSQAVAWSPGEVRGGVTVPEGSRRVAPAGNGQAASDFATWPKPDAVARRCRIADATADGVGSLVDLWERSPVHVDRSADDWLDYLLPDAEWLCLAVDHPATARSRRREQWSFGPADECGLVVPSPMTGPSGNGLDGRRSHRCLDNTGPRRWLVIEFDKGSIDEQAAIHWHFRACAETCGWPPLVLCVHSGGKSLHGWYGPVANEEAARDLMGYAATLGADTATWLRCQLIRLPGGVRASKRPDMGNPISLPDGWPEPAAMTRQEVFFFNPFKCPMPSMNNSSAPGVPSISTPRPVLMEAA